MAQPRALVSLPDMPTREERIRFRLFKGEKPFDPKGAGFVPLPMILRRLQFLFSPRGWQVYCYVLMRAGPSGIAWFELGEVAFDLGFKSLPKLAPYIRELVDAGWVVTASSKGKHYFMAVDPLQVIERLKAASRLSEERLEAIEELLDALRPARARAAVPAPGIAAGGQTVPAVALTDGSAP